MRLVRRSPHIANGDGVRNFRAYVTRLGVGPADTVREGEVQQLMEYQRADARKNDVQGTVILGG